MTDAADAWVVLSLAPARRERVPGWFDGLAGEPVESVLNGLSPVVTRRCVGR